MRLSARAYQVAFAQSTSIAAIGLGISRTLFMYGALGTSQFGIFATLYETAALLGAFAGLNTGDYLARECPGRAPSYQQRALRLAWLLSLPGATLALVAAFAAHAIGNQSLDVPSLAFMFLAGAAVLNMWGLMLQGYMYGLERVYFAQCLNIALAFGWFVVLVPIRWLGHQVTLELVFLIWFLVDLLLLGIALWALRRVVFGGGGHDTIDEITHDRPSGRSAIGFCLALYPRTLSKSLFSLGDRYILLGMGEFRALSFFSVLKDAVGVATNLGNQLSAVVSPQYFRLVNTVGADSDQVRSSMARLLWLSLLITFAAALGFWGFAPDLVALFEGEGLMAMVLWVAPVPLLWNLVTVVERWYLGTGAMRRLAATRLAVIALYILAAQLLSNAFGPIGVTIAMAALYAVLFVLLMWPRAVRLGINWDIIPTGPLVLLGIGTFCTLVPVARAAVLPLWIRVPIFCVGYASALACFMTLSFRGREALKALQGARK